MYLRYGPYTHAQNEPAVQIGKRAIFSPRGLRQAVRETWRIVGVLHAASQPALTAAIAGLRSAYNVNGYGWVIDQLPTLLQVNGTATLAVLDNSTTARLFDLVNGNYQARFFDQSQLTHSGNEYVLTDSAGDQIRFYDFSTSFPVNQRGRFKSYTDPYGNQTSVTRHRRGVVVRLNRMWMRPCGATPS